MAQLKMYQTGCDSGGMWMRVGANIYYIFFSFTLYPAHNTLVRRNLGTYCHISLSVAIEHFRFPHSQCMLSGGTQRCALPCYQNEKIKILNI